MLFNSGQYLLFLPVVFILYWFVMNKTVKLQNILLMAASYFFYSCWDYRFMFLLLFSTLLDFYTGIRMHEAKSEAHRKTWFWISIGVNLGLLAVLKYYNFFIGSFADMLNVIGIQPNIWTLKIILPVGISFYTFHGLSYVIDIYKGRIKPEYNFIDYSLFVCYFPLLVAGPIERATHLLPQVKERRTFSYAMAVSGLRQMLWGMFKKVVIADNCAEYVNAVYNNYDTASGSALLIASVLFAIQIYCDFSGYSDIALGTSRLFGIELLRNFAYPYFSRDIAEFWRRWHISLSSWFKDYLYIPLGGSKGGKWMQVRNTFIIFLVSGFWHGANWTFIVWGFLNALYFLPLLLLNKNRTNIDIVAKGKFFPSLHELYQITTTFLLCVLAWVFFRSETIGQALFILSKIFSPSLLSTAFHDINKIGFAVLAALILFFMIIEWIGREQDYALAKISGVGLNRTVRWVFYSFIFFLIGMYMQTNETEFIYFQF